MQDWVTSVKCNKNKEKKIHWMKQGSKIVVRWSCGPAVPPSQIWVDLEITLTVCDFDYHNWCWLARKLFDTEIVYKAYQLLRASCAGNIAAHLTFFNNDPWTTEAIGEGKREIQGNTSRRGQEGNKANCSA